MKEELLHLVERLKRDSRLATYDEAATKQTVVLPVLSSLGWDIFSIDEVRPEYSVGNQRVDYALRQSEANRVFIEVKKVSEDLEKHQEQLLNYSFKAGVSLAILTNGISWQFYLPLLREVSWEQRKFYTIEIRDQDNEVMAGKFVNYLAKEKVYSGEYLKNAEADYRNQQKEHLIKETLPKAWDKLILEPDELLVELVADATEKLCGYRPDNSVVEIFLSSVTSIARGGQVPGGRRTKKKPTGVEGYTGKSVTAFIFGSTRYQVRYWIEVLLQVCRLMYRSNRSSFDAVLQLRGSKRPYFSRNPNELRIPQQIEDTGVFMETNLSSAQIVRISVDVISLFGYSQEDLVIEAN